MGVVDLMAQGRVHLAKQENIKVVAAQGHVLIVRHLPKHIQRQMGPEKHYHQTVSVRKDIGITIHGQVRRVLSVPPVHTKVA